MAKKNVETKLTPELGWRLQHAADAFAAAQQARAEEAAAIARARARLEDRELASRTRFGLAENGYNSHLAAVCFEGKIPADPKTVSFVPQGPGAWIASFEVDAPTDPKLSDEDFKKIGEQLAAKKAIEKAGQEARLEALAGPKEK